MKYLLSIVVLILSTAAFAESMPGYLVPAYQVAYQAVSGSLDAGGFELFYDYIIDCDDDQIVEFQFSQGARTCIADVRSESLKLENFYCR
jgi:hypothetical protein